MKTQVFIPRPTAKPTPQRAALAIDQIVHPPRLELGLTVSKTVVISVSLWVREYILHYNSQNIKSLVQYNT